MLFYKALNSAESIYVFLRPLIRYKWANRAEVWVTMDRLLCSGVCPFVVAKTQIVPACSEFKRNFVNPH